MRVFKFYSCGYYYGYAAETKELAEEKLFEEIGEIEIDKVEEIPELEWDEKTINIWEDNDFNKIPWKESINDIIVGTEPQMVFTNDFSIF